jgi:hypothetical protein
LPASRGVGFYVDFDELEVVQHRDFQVGREDRHPDCDLVARDEQAVLAHSIEHVGDRRRAAFSREQIEGVGGQLPADHPAHEIMLGDAFGDRQDTRRCRIFARQDARYHFVQEVGGGKAKLVTHIRHGGGEETDAGHLPVGGHEAAEAALHAVLVGEAADALRHIGE